MDFGRFAFTGLYPPMVADHQISVEGGSYAASADYAGYLIGALLAALLSGIPSHKLCSVATVMTVITLGLLALPMPEWLIVTVSRSRRKKVGDGRCGRRARASRSSVRSMQIEIADGAPVSGNRGIRQVGQRWCGNRVAYPASSPEGRLRAMMRKMRSVRSRSRQQPRPGPTFRMPRRGGASGEMTAAAESTARRATPCLSSRRLSVTISKVRLLPVVQRLWSRKPACAAHPNRRADCRRPASP
nr:YbfB/YjiJ family MFS transporter [Ensifer sp. NM-2]